jgi:hypothetical protein
MTYRLGSIVLTKLSQKKTRGYSEHHIQSVNSSGMGWSLNYEVYDWNENRNRMDRNIDRKDLYRDEVGSWDMGLECRGVNSNGGL